MEMAKTNWWCQLQDTVRESQEFTDFSGTPGKPSVGAIFIFQGDELTDLEVSQPFSTGQVTDVRFGHAIKAVDFNCDGFAGTITWLRFLVLDLAVSSPNFGSDL